MAEQRWKQNKSDIERLEQNQKLILRACIEALDGNIRHHNTAKPAGSVRRLRGKLKDILDDMTSS